MRLPLLVLLTATLLKTCLGQNKAARARRLGTEATILKQLEGRSDAETRPPVRDAADHSAIVVVASIFINRIEWDNDGGAQVDLFLRQQWEDGRLAYDVDPRENIDEVALPSSVDIWTPDTYVSSGHETKVEGRRRVLVEPSGHVRSTEERLVQTTASPASSAFVQSLTLNLRLSSYKYPLEDVVYLWANSPPLVVPVEVSQELLQGNLQFEHAVAGDCVGNYSVGVYSCIDVVLTFKSTLMHGLSTVLLPTSLLLIFSWLHMWLHGSWSVPRSLSAILPFIIFAALLLFSPSSWTSSSCWLLFCLAFSFLSLLEYFVVICWGVRRSTIRYVPGTQSDPSFPQHKEHTQVVAEPVPSNSKCSFSESPIDAVCRIAFPILFLIFTLIFFFILN